VYSSWPKNAIADFGFHVPKFATDARVYFQRLWNDTAQTRMRLKGYHLTCFAIIIIILMHNSINLASPSIYNRMSSPSDLFIRKKIAYNAVYLWAKRKQGHLKIASMLLTPPAIDS
jgi:hypothetical protein